MNNLELLEGIKKFKNEIDDKFETAISLVDENFEFECVEFSETEINKIEKMSNVIYYIEIYDFQDFQCDTFLKKFKKFKDSNKKKIKLPQINKESKSKILYVGKSSTDFQTRINCHYGNKSLSTYSIHYKTWSDKDFFKNLKFRLYYYQFQRPIHKDVLEIIESAFHFKFNPLLGRSGH